MAHRGRRGHARAREFGDLSENFQYHAAKNEQGLLEGRIRVLRHRIDGAALIDEDAAAASDKVTIGSKVVVEDEGGERMEVEISSAGSVPRVAAGPRRCSGARRGESARSEAPRAAGAPG